ncbi:MAG: hypothetical protein AAFP26_11550, partial [Planctomycetota bacterium]
MHTPRADASTPTRSEPDGTGDRCPVDTGGNRVRSGAVPGASARPRPGLPRAVPKQGVQLLAGL